MIYNSKYLCIFFNYLFRFGLLYDSSSKGLNMIKIFFLRTCSIMWKGGWCDACNGDFGFTMANVGLTMTNIDLTMANIGLTMANVDLTMTNVDLTMTNIDLTMANIELTMAILGIKWAMWWMQLGFVELWLGGWIVLSWLDCKYLWFNGRYELLSRMFWLILWVRN